ncbi:MAG: ATP-binding protein [Bacteroidota bacterium]
MAYKKYKLVLGIRLIALFVIMMLLSLLLSTLNFNSNLVISLTLVILVVAVLILMVKDFFKLTFRRFSEMDDFFKAVKHRDFSRWFSLNTKAEDIKELRKGFNDVNATLIEIKKEKETQHLYLQKILELIQTGIMAYNIQTGKVLWINDSFKKMLDVPTLKQIDFVQKRKPKLYETVFETNHSKQNTIVLTTGGDKVKILISSSRFDIKQNTFKLLVLQNIEETLNQNENEAWKKLLRVMNHEIMNSITPISSLAETLHAKIEGSRSNDISLDIEDLEQGIDSIRKRSIGLMKFAEKYRGLNKITTLDLKKTIIIQLFAGIQDLLKPSLDQQNITLQIKVDNSETYLEIDAYLIEQVLINLVLNAVEALKNQEHPKITLIGEKNIDGTDVIKVMDNGEGIAEEIMDSVFIPFFSTKDQGSGIGLNLCKQIMLLHKGKIQINSIEGKGTTVSLVFPNTK